MVMTTDSDPTIVDILNKTLECVDISTKHLAALVVLTSALGRIVMDARGVDPNELFQNLRDAIPQESREMIRQAVGARPELTVVDGGREAGA
jgi:hypothetical protein